MARKSKTPRKPNKPYELPSKSVLKDSTIRVLSFDPGIRNFGISCVATDRRNFRVVSNAVLMHPMDQMNQFEKQKKVFLEEVGNWVDLYKPQALIAERFMLRGAGTGMAMGELVPSMVALVSGYFKLNTLTIPAAQWKVPHQNRFKFDLKETYKEILVEPHQLDSSMIGFYGLERGLNLQFDIEIKTIIKQVEDTSLLPLKEYRRRR